MAKMRCALALACGMVEGENLERLKLNDYNVTNFPPSLRNANMLQLFRRMHYHNMLDWLANVRNFLAEIKLNSLDRPMVVN